MRANKPIFIVLLASCQALALEPITPANAIRHVGETATVCGTAVGVKYATTTRRQPTFINLDQPYPRQVFTALIWGSDRPRFHYALESLQGKRICIFGLIEEYKGRAEIIVRDPSQISVK